MSLFLCVIFCEKSETLTFNDFSHFQFNMGDFLIGSHSTGDHPATEALDDYYLYFIVDIFFMSME